MSDTAMYQFNWRQVEESKTVQALTEQWQKQNNTKANNLKKRILTRRTVPRDLVEDTINREQ